MNLIEWLPAVVLLLVAVGLAFAHGRMRERLQVVEHDRSGYLRIFEKANDGVLVIDLVSGVIHQANEKAAGMLGYTSAELARRTIFTLHSKAYLDQSARRIADAWGSDGLVYDDIPFVTADGRDIPVECSTRVTSYDGRPAVILYVRDITERIRLQQDVAERNALVELQNNEMLSGLRYAQGIQQAMLPSLSQLRSAFADAFVLFKPRDIVSGDFYWCGQVGSKSVLAVADCTGHGVPGALLSMTGITLLQQIVSGRGITVPASILEALRTELLRSLAHQEGEAQMRDGMDIGIVSYDRITRECEFSGALCPLYILRAGTGELEEIKGDRVPIGFDDGRVRGFTSHLIALNSGDRLFMGSDGFTDQFGGPLGRKLKTAGMKELLLRSVGSNLCRTGRGLEAGFREWQGGLDQLDDVTLVGVQV